LPEWIHTQAADPLKIRMLRNDLELGEASAIALAVETPESLLILDDKKARRVAETLGLQLTGALGVIAKAYRTGLIANSAGVIADLRQSNFRVPRDFERIILNSP
jgi:predicted nucleic acid-binding protein